MKEVRSAPNSVILTHGNVQHAESEWRKERCIRFQSDLISKSHDLPDGIASADIENIFMRSKQTVSSLDRSLYRQKEAERGIR